MKILHCYPHACLGGGSSYDFRSLSASLVKYHADVDLHITFPSPPEVNIVKNQHNWILPFRLMGSSSIYWPDCKQYNNLTDRELEQYIDGLYKHLLKLVQDIKPDIIHCHFLLPSGWAAARIGKKHNIPVIITSHGADLKMMEIDNRYLEGSIEHLQSVRQFIGHSPDHMAWIQELLPSEFKQKVKYIPGGVDTEYFSPQTDTAFIEQHYDLKPKEFILGVGRFQRRKGFHILLEAAQEINYPVVLIGEGWEMEALKQQAKQLSLTNTHFLGFLGPDQTSLLKQFYATAGVTVIPSLTREETLCFVGLEAMASGTAVVASNVGGLKYILGEGEAGMLIEPGKPDELVSSIDKIMNSLELRTELGEKARNRAKTVFIWGRVAQKYYDLYRSVL